MEEALEQTASRRSFIFGSAKSSFSRRTYNEGKFACNPALIGQNVHVHSSHIHVSFAFYQLSLRIIVNFLLNNGVDK